MSEESFFKRVRARIAAIERKQWIIGGLSLTMTTIIMYTFLIENRFGYMKPDPIIAYFKNWDDGRSRDEALAQQEEEERLMQEQAEAVAAQLDIAAEEAESAAAPAEPAAPPGPPEPAEPAAPAEPPEPASE
ncbi:hypothetical protein [Sphingosinicella soli]|uniref:Uncharacterized protein n=1 Tax=Sphingosinicella soli TaxID=333708 RepID=A0A7W7B1V5_9SPHN|nr:hypothetical protein [Sphingosinicella soli]MBB4632488.1 hypothetical protein [Sphingosinicella soli]